jgi:hypothetical protein
MDPGIKAFTFLSCLLLTAYSFGLGLRGAHDSPRP